MSDFVNQFWNWYVILLVLVSIIACGVLLWTQSVTTPGKGDTTGHVWDENLEEYNNPLPKWWMWLFYITVIFSLVYCVLYPTLGSYQGVLGWSSDGQWACLLYTSVLWRLHSCRCAAARGQQRRHPGFADQVLLGLCWCAGRDGAVVLSLIHI